MSPVRIALLVLVACVETAEPLPDAAVDQDACMREPDADGCCALMPDLEAVGACAAETVAEGVCGVAVCWQADCSLARVNFCNR